MPYPDGTLLPALPVGKISKVLPDNYYLTHFEDFVQNIADTYFDILSSSEQRLLIEFKQLSFPERQLFVRLSNRTRSAFSLSKLKYPEIESIHEAAAGLIRRGFLRTATSQDLELCLHEMTKREILQLLTKTDSVSGDRTAGCRGKASVLNLALSIIDFEIFAASTTYQDFVVREFEHELRFLYFLAFGNIYSDLKLYALRDLGVRSPSGRTTQFKRRFATEDEARSEYFFRSLRQKLESLPVEQLLVWVDNLNLPHPTGPGATRARDKLVYEAAQLLIRNKDFDRSLKLLKIGNSDQIVERRIRLLHSLRKAEELQVELDQIYSYPASSHILSFAEEFSATKLGRIRRSALTSALKLAKSIRLDATYRGRPEQGVIDWLTGQGRRAYHVENDLWLTLFGTSFWNELYENSDSSVFSEFDLIPQDLVNGTFYERNKTAIVENLSKLRDPLKARELLERAWREHYGKPNRIFQWSRIDKELIFEFLTGLALCKADIEPIILQLAKNFEASKRGFPDLLVFHESKPFFVEVKSLGDKLHPAQLRQLELLSASGFEASIIRTEWEYQSDQTYVVVDVETTGTSPSNGRIIEIGAVKVQNGSITDRFSTLVNPEIRLPNMISALTGISRSMLEGAPRFADVSQAFSQFLGDSIFVAHNARFDSAFISAEYRRLGKQFSAPLMCTAQGMRNTHPGLESYSLDALCREFEICLTRHHRALPDAEAAAQLLLLILQSNFAENKDPIFVD